MKTIIMIIIALAALGCEDISGLEENREKELIFRIMTPADSLAGLAIEGLDLGSVKMRTVSHVYFSIRNSSDTATIKIYKIDNTNKSGKFNYLFPKGLPFELLPGEDTRYTEKIQLKFIADAFVTKHYYDTVYFNGNLDFYAPVKVKIRY